VTTAASSYMRGDRAPGLRSVDDGNFGGENRAGIRHHPRWLWKTETLPNGVVFTMLGREAPLDFFRRSGIPIRGEWSAKTWISFLAFFAFCSFVYVWKASSHLNQVFQQRQWFPFNVPGWLTAVGGTIAAASADPRTFLGTLTIDLAQPGFYYSLGYTLAILAFGLRRINAGTRPMCGLQTYSLMAFQFIPLFLLPYIVLPLMGHNGWFDSGGMKTIADNSVSGGELRPRA